MSGAGWALHAEAWQRAPSCLFVDHILTDPPYDARTHSGHALPNRDRDAVSFDPIDPADIVPALLERAAGWVICFCALEQLGAYRDAAAGAWYRAGVWDKVNPCPQMNGQGPAQAVEGVAVMWAPWGSGRRRRRPEWHGGGKAGIWRHCPAHGPERLHETPKPVGLLVELVELFTAPGEQVWDPYAGSATTGVACLRRGRKFVGHEIDPTVADLACRRLAAEARGLDLHAAERGQLSILDVTGD